MSGNDSYTVLLVHSDTTDGSTTFTDSAIGGNAPHTLTAQADAQHSTDQKKFGASSIYLDGNDYIISADDSDWDIGSNDFTIDAWIRLDSIPSVGRILARGDVSSSGNWCLGIGTVWGGGTKLNFADNESGISDHLSNALSVNTDTWYHVAIVRASGTITFYLDGVASGTASCSHTLNSSSRILIGGRDGATEFFPGYIDELRFSNGIARWTENFAVPTSAYSIEDTTVTAAVFTLTDSLDGSPALSIPAAVFSETLSLDTPTIFLGVPITAAPFTLTDTLVVPTMAAGIEFDFTLDLRAVVQVLQDLGLDLRVSKTRLLDLILDLRITDGDHLEDLLTDLRITDGITLQDLALDLRLIKLAPSFSTYISHRLSSIKKDSGLSL